MPYKKNRRRSVLIMTLKSYQSVSVQRIIKGILEVWVSV